MQLPLAAGGYPTWTAAVSLPPNTAFQYKFIRKETNGTVSASQKSRKIRLTGFVGRLGIRPESFCDDTWLREFEPDVELEIAKGMSKKTSEAFEMQQGCTLVMA